MKRREFIVLTVSSSLPGISFAQQAMPVIGYLFGALLQNNVETFAAFKKGLAQEGFFDGQNCKITVHSADRNAGGLAEAAANMIRDRAKVIVAAGGNDAVNVAIFASKSTPVVFATGGDPVALGFVRSISRPDTNVTGATFYTEVESKIVGLISRFFPELKRYEILHRRDQRSIHRAQRLSNYLASSGSTFRISMTDSPSEVKAAISSVDASQPTALLPISDVMFNSMRWELANASKDMGLALFGYTDEQCEAGAVLTYGASRPEMFRQLGIYAGRILKGIPVSDLPVVYLERFELNINSSAGAAVGLRFPPDLLALADKVYG